MLSVLSIILALGFLVTAVGQILSYYGLRCNDQAIVSCMVYHHVKDMSSLGMRTPAVLEMQSVIPNWWRRRKVLKALVRCEKDAHIVRLSKRDAAVTIIALRNHLSAALCAEGIMRAEAGLPCERILAQFALLCEPVPVGVEQKPRIAVISEKRLLSPDWKKIAWKLSFMIPV